MRRGQSFRGHRENLKVEIRGPLDEGLVGGSSQCLDGLRPGPRCPETTTRVRRTCPRKGHQAEHRNHRHVPNPLARESIPKAKPRAPHSNPYPQPIDLSNPRATARGRRRPAFRPLSPRSGEPIRPARSASKRRAAHRSDRAGFETELNSQRANAEWTGRGSGTWKTR